MEVSTHSLKKNSLMEKETATEWLFEQVWINPVSELPKILEQAKEIEKQQIINAFWNGDNTDCTSEQNSKEFAEQYYNETYGSKGSDEHIEHNLDEIVTSSQTEISDEEWKKIVKDMSKQPMTFVPNEISDEDIEKAAKEYILYNDQKRAWVIEGMKLYREQLKSRQ